MIIKHYSNVMASLSLFMSVSKEEHIFKLESFNGLNWLLQCSVHCTVDRVYWEYCFTCQAEMHLNFDLKWSFVPQPTSQTIHKNFILHVNDMQDTVTKLLGDSPLDGMHYILFVSILTVSLSLYVCVCECVCTRKTSKLIGLTHLSAECVNIVDIYSDTGVCWISLRI